MNLNDVFSAEAHGPDVIHARKARIAAVLKDARIEPDAVTLGALMMLTLMLKDFLAEEGIEVLFVTPEQAADVQAKLAARDSNMKAH